MNFDDLDGAHAVVTGAAGFLGSHLCTRLVGHGARVTAIDNYITGRVENLSHLVGESGFTLVDYDVTNFLHVPGEVDFILHFASPASPADYLRWPIQTLKVGSLGTHKVLGLARAKGARLLLASTSEVYGDPLVNPQPETYWGNVNPVGPRGVYDEAKRFAEAMTLAYHREHGVDVRISRTFNSILADEQVLFDDGTELRRESVEDIHRRLLSPERLEGCSVPAFNEDARIASSETIALVRHRTLQACYEVRTRYGRSVRVTGDHSLFVEGDDGSPVARPVNDLRVGDRIAVAGRVDVPERDRESVDVIDLLVDRISLLGPWDIFVHAPGLEDQIWEHRFDVLTAALSQRPAGTSRQSAWGYVHAWKNAGELPLAVFRKIGLAMPEGDDVQVRKKGSTVRVGRHIELTDELLWLLGLHVAEGCRFDKGTKSASISISGEMPLLQRAKKIIERDLGLHVVVTPPKEERSAAISVHSQLLLMILDELGFYPGPKRIPGWVLGLPLPRLKWFMEGYREGDGIHSGKKYEAQKLHEFSTSSELLRDDLIVALGRFGLVPSVGSYETTLKKRTGDRRYPFWRVSVNDVSPWSPLEWDKGVKQNLQARRTGDLVWAVVRSIEEVDPTEYVYDFCVPGRENFWAGRGVLAHNTYGPIMRVDDGRAVPAFFSAALRNAPLPVFGDGSQTRSLCYVDDQVEGLLRLLVSDYVGPVNIGNPEEVTILELAQTIQDVVGNHPGIDFQPMPTDDPKVRRPDTTLAEEVLGWNAQVGLRDGLARTVGWFSDQLGIR